MKSNKLALLESFCNRVAISFEAACGKRRTPGGLLDDYQFHPGVDPDSDVVEALRIKPSGRFGNNVHQILNAHHIANCLGIPQVIYPDIKLPWFGKEARPEPTPVPEIQGAVLEGAFFYPWVFSRQIASVDVDTVARISRETLQPLCGVDPVRVNTENRICVHIRSGDIFKPNPNQWYAQPPLAFYVKAIDDIREAHRDLPVLVVYEDRGNPVVDALLDHLAAKGIVHHPQSSAHLSEDAWAIMSSRILVAGKGSFVPALSILSPTKDQVSCFRAFGNRGHEYARYSTAKLSTYADKADNYIQRDWTNSKQQRQQMIDYPIDAIALASEWTLTGQTEYELHPVPSPETLESMPINEVRKAIRMALGSTVKHHYALHGLYETIIYIIYRDWIAKPSSVAIEVGAYKGLHTLRLADCLGPQGKVVAFEPLPDLAEAITLKVAETYKEPGRVDVRQVALSDRSGTALFYHRDQRSHSSLLPDTTGVGSVVETLEVEVQTLDMVLGQNDSKWVTVLKIDAEGAEYDILKNGCQFFKDSGPLIIMKITPEQYTASGATLGDFFKLIDEIDYVFYNIDGSPFDQEYVTKGDVFHCKERFGARREHWLDTFLRERMPYLVARQLGRAGFLDIVR